MPDDLSPRAGAPAGVDWRTQGIKVNLDLDPVADPEWIGEPGQ